MLLVPLAQSKDWRKWVRCAIVVSVITLCSCASLACGGADGILSRVDASRPIQVVGHAEVLLFPRLGAGESGWCVTTTSIGASACPTFGLPTLAGPIVLENWVGQSTSSGGPANEAVILTTSDVAAVRLPGYESVPTRVGAGLPQRLRFAVMELRGGADKQVLGISAPPPTPSSHFMALNARGQPISQSRALGPPLEFHLPRRSVTQSQQAREGVCRLHVAGTGGLVFNSGDVMMSVLPRPNVRGREFVSCSSATYNDNGWPLEVSVLLDAARPGFVPAPLPLMRPLASHSGVFHGPGAEGEMVARRIHGAWLIVGKGRGLSQRLMLLKDVQAKVTI